MLSQEAVRAVEQLLWTTPEERVYALLDGASVKRVLTTATTSAVYSSADQTADWGAPLAPGDTLTIRIFQLSTLIGRGAPKTVTLGF